MYHPESFPAWHFSVYLTSRDDIVCYGQDRILNFIDVIFDEDTNAPNTFYLPNFDQPFLAEINGSKQVPYPYTPMSDKDKISPYSINTISSRQVIRIKKNIIKGLLIKTRPISPN